MTTIQALIFDYDGVMTASADRVQQYEAAAAALGLTVEELYQRLWESEGWQQVKRGQITDRDFWRGMLPVFGLDADDWPTGPLAFLVQETLDPLMVGLVQRLRGRYQVALLSNATPAYETRWLNFGLYDLFDVIINSAAVGLAKPDPEIYHLALQRLGRQPAECLFIDDKPRNTLAAEALGIASLVFTTPTALEADLARMGILEQSSVASRQ
ncbi:MAG: HAD family phosphatase [Anaerolineae bacterium]|nr:HAD family phosphatase [Anaerolineae bacterium]